MSDPNSLTNPMGNLANPSESDFERIVRRYREQLCALVSREMGQRFRSREDAEDTVQSALRSFWRGIPTHGWVIDHKGKLWGLLTTITRHKMLKHVEREGCLKRNPDKEVSYEPDMLASRDPSPEDAAVAADFIERIMEGLEPPDPEILRLQLEGRTHQEIADRLGCTTATVRFKLERLKTRLARLLKDAAD